MSTNQRLLGYFWLYRTRIFWGLLATSLMGMIDTILASGVGLLVKILSEIDLLTRESSTFKIPVSIKELNYSFTITESSQIYFFVGLFLFIIFFKVLFVYAREYLMNSAANKILLNLRQEIFDRIVQLPMSFFDRSHTGDIMARITNDVVNIESSLVAGVNFTQSFIYTIIFITALFITSWKLTIFAILVYPLSGLIIKYFGDQIRRVSRKLSMNVADLTSFLQEKISSIKVVKGFVREERERIEFDKRAKENYHYSIKNVRLGAWLKPINEMFSTLAMVLVIIFCSYQFINHQMTIDIMTRFIILITMAYRPIKSIGEASAIYQKALASASRIFEIMDIETEHEETNFKPHDIEKIKGHVTFDHVTFSYIKNIPALKDFSLKVRSGETVAFVGPSGGGKSTILNLLPRFYNVTTGRILIDGIDTREILLGKLRSFFGIVLQETILFSGTVEDNIRYGKLDASKERIVESAKAANAHQFISELLDGYHTQVGEKGIQLSGGQRQRIAIARAILCDPKILLLDEATSALDTESEIFIQEALERLMQGRTSFIIAHRLSTVQKASRIIVIDKGQIVEEGNHRQLLQKNGLYKKLYLMQFK